MTITIRDTLNDQSVSLTPGCYIDGHWGQYGLDRLAEILADFQDIAPDDDPRVWRQRAELAESMAGPDDRWPGANEWQNHHESADDILDTLNSLTTGGYWEWEDGELFLTDNDDDDDDA